jgi:PAS domain-containing protein
MSSTGTPRLITIPASDRAFARQVEATVRDDASSTPAALQGRLRLLFPRVLVRERSLSDEAPAWYVYRDGHWHPGEGDWWNQPNVPCVRVNGEGRFTALSPMAADLFEVEAGDASSMHFADFAVPGALPDAIHLFRIVLGGDPLDATLVIRPRSGNDLAVDVHAVRDGEEIVGYLRLAADVVLPQASPDGTGPTLSITPNTDIAFRWYVERALRMIPEHSPQSLELRIRRLYPHATVAATDDGWRVERDASRDAHDDRWWSDRRLPLVHYDAQGLIVRANEAADAMLGQPLVGRFWHELVTPGSTDEVSEMLEILRAIGQAESRFRMPDATGRLVEFDSYTVVDDETFTTVMRPTPPPGARR